LDSWKFVGGLKNRTFLIFANTFPTVGPNVTKFGYEVYPSGLHIVAEKSQNSKTGFEKIGKKTIF
jgi:hypothetical protein